MRCPLPRPRPRCMMDGMKCVAAALLLTLLSAAACGEKEPRAGSATINGAVFAHLIQLEGERPGILVVDPASTPLKDDDAGWAATWKYVRAVSLRGLRDDTCANLVKANEDSKDLSNALDAPLPVTLFRESDWAALLEQGGGNEGAWARFHVRHPKARAWISLSLPGVSADGRQAVIWIGKSWGALGGWSGYGLLERENGLWKVIALCITEQA